MHKTNWADKYLYETIIQIFPDLLKTRPGVYDEFIAEVNTPNDMWGNRSKMFVTKTQPLASVIPFITEWVILTDDDKEIQLIDKQFYAKPTEQFFDDKYGKPTTKIQQTTRNLLVKIADLMKPLTSYIFGFHSDVSIKKIQEGDIKVIISEVLPEHKYPKAEYTLIVNHTKKTSYIMSKTIELFDFRDYSRKDEESLVSDDGKDFLDHMKSLGIELHSRERS